MSVELAPFLPGIIAAYALLLVGATSPGPAVAMLLGIATTEGRGPALVTCVGIACGSSVINLGTLIGVGLVLSQAAWAMTLLKLIGAGYLLWLAWGAFRRALRPPRVMAMEAPVRTAGQLFTLGFLLQVTNPKAIAFWLAIATIGATEGGGPVIVALFVAGAWTLSFLSHGGWAVLLSSGPVRRGYAAIRHWVEAALGTFFGFAAYKIATTEV